MNDMQSIIQSALRVRASEVGRINRSDVLVVSGPMTNDLPRIVRDLIEKSEVSADKLSIVLKTLGGSIDAVERIVSIIRKHYMYVDFIIPDMAMSAGTVFALSGDNIYMDYYSVLGPIDPQFEEEGVWVPALAYLEKYEELDKKAAKNNLTPLEAHLANQISLIKLHIYEQARDHSIELLQTWLTKYKFKDWDKTDEEKIEKAKDIAEKLNKTTRWHAHSRGISMETLVNELGLKINDLNANTELKVSASHIDEFLLDMNYNIVAFTPRSPEE